jgi:hypothetical protein
MGEGSTSMGARVARRRWIGSMKKDARPARYIYRPPKAGLPFVAVLVLGRNLRAVAAWSESETLKRIEDEEENLIMDIHQQALERRYGRRRDARRP